MSRPFSAVGLGLVAVCLVVAVSACGGGKKESSGTNPSDPHVAMGGHLFVSFACASCHGKEAKGDGPFPRLAGQLSAYVSRQLTNWSKERSETTSDIMAPIVSTGPPRA